jgi:hypothetical protein
MILPVLRRAWKKYAVEITVGSVGLIAMNLIFLAGAFRQGTTVTREAAGQLGDFVGGFVGPSFSLLGIVLLIRTLKDQRTSAEIQSFENKYFELLRLHRDNVEEIDLQGASGRKLFVILLRELRCALEILDELIVTQNAVLTREERLHVAYYCVFFGVGPNSSRTLKEELSEFPGGLIDALEAVLNNKETKARVRNQRRFKFIPFEGHQSRLGHYYRHLYQTVRYVDQQQLEIKHYAHVKTIRAQLSTHEQAMLLVNSLTPLGRNWWRNDLIVKYKLVKNLPRHFFDETEIDMRTLFPQNYFEWEERAISRTPSSSEPSAAN